jgi:hypothetical protein
MDHVSYCCDGLYNGAKLLVEWGEENGGFLFADCSIFAQDSFTILVTYIYWEMQSARLYGALR